MRLIDRLTASRAAPSADLSASVLRQTYTAGDAERLQGTFASYAADGYQANGIVFAVLQRRVALFSETRFQWQRLNDKSLWGDQNLKLLEEPWPGGSTGELLARMEQDASLAGNAFIAREPGRLRRLRPDWTEFVMTPETNGHRSLLGYLHRPNGGYGDAIFYLPEEVAHYAPIPDPLGRRRGMSWLTPVAREVDADALMTSHKSDFFRNSATPNALIKYQQKLGTGAKERLAAAWSARYGGSEGWGTAVLDEGADFQVIGSSFESMNFAGVQAAGENRIAAAGGVPAIVVGLKEGLDSATYSNFAQAMRAFADLTMRPLWREVCAALSVIVPPPSGSRLWYDTRDIAALSAGEQDAAATMAQQAATLSTLLAAGFDPDSAKAAVTAGDLTLLRHTGLLSVQLQPPGSTPTSAPAEGATP